MSNQPEWHLPKRTSNYEGKPRRVGIEIEMGGIEPRIITDILVDLYGGSTHWESPFSILINATSFGDFRLELDSEFVKGLGKKSSVSGHPDDQIDSLEKFSLAAVGLAAEQLVPWEIVSPPIEITRLAELSPLVERLRHRGARGTRHAARYAFGVHFNPEAPSLEAGPLLDIFRAYLCLYDWIAAGEQVDFSRQLTPYIKHFPKKYISLVVNRNYQPDLQGLMDDYLLANPTRNRSLDLLPLFAHIDEDRVRRAVDDPRIKSRPTFHYRLPNCDIDNPDWNLSQPWERWYQVEKLAEDIPRLRRCCAAYQEYLAEINLPFDQTWARGVTRFLAGSTSL